METYFLYLLKASACLTIIYLGFLLLFRNSAAFKQQRLFLLLAVLLAFALPLNQFSLRTLPAAEPTEPIVAQQLVTAPEQTQTILSIPEQPATLPVKPLDPWKYINILYITITSLMILRILVGICRFLLIVTKVSSFNFKGRKLYLSPQISGSTSFFKWLFIHPDLKGHPDLEKIISHENIHASQYHTLDVLLVELLAAAMWFNPVVWFLRRSLQQLHEYLADEGVINSGYDRLEYQKLLVNHIAEETLLLSSGFQSSIKKRIIMITKHKPSRGMEKKLLALLPIAAGILVAISCMNKPKAVEATSKDSLYKVTEDKPTATIKNDSTDKLLAEKSGNKEIHVTAIAPTKMNVLYLGADNPVDIAVSGIPADKIRPSVTNGSIVKTGYGYVVRPKILGNEIIVVEAMIEDKWQKMGNMEFRVKRVPDPVAKLAGKKSGKISKDEIVKAGKIYADMENFDFDLSFRVVSFSFPVSAGNVIKDFTTNSDTFTPEQLEVIKSFPKGQRFYIDNIKCVGPDGTIRDISPLSLEIE